MTHVLTYVHEHLPCSQVLEITHGDGMRIDIANAKGNASFKLCARPPLQADLQQHTRHMHGVSANGAANASGEKAHTVTSSVNACA